MPDSVDPRVRRGWYVAGGLAAVGMFAFGTLSAIGVVAREDRVISREFDAGGIDVVEVSSDAGDVRVFGDAESTVRVTIRLREGLVGVDREARVEGRRLVLRSDCPDLLATFCDARYEVHVPPDVEVVARSEQGDASVSGVDGGAVVESTNGDVGGDRLGGDVRLSTRNGDVQGTALDAATLQADSRNGDVDVDLAQPPSRLTAGSNNGNVVVRLPNGSEMYAVDATTDNGELSTAVRTDPEGRRRIVARSDNGDVSVRYR